MKQPEYSPLEALERIKLMMKYDMSKTLNENKEVILEIVPLVIAGVTIAPWVAAASAAAVASIGTWIYNVQGGGDSFSKTKSFFEGCSKNIKELKPTVSKSEYRAAADAIYNAIEGIGTTLPAIKSALDSMPTVADLCALNSWYTTQYGDLYDDLDSDIDGSDFTKYVWSAIAPKVADAEDDLENTEKTKVTGGTKTKTTKYKVCSGTYTQGCYSEVIKKVQGCLGGLVTDGKFGSKTNEKLKNAGFSSGFSDNDVEKICDKKDTVNNTGYEDYTTDEIETSVESASSAPANNAASVQQGKKSFIGPPNDDAVEQ
jgi:hypothetical protein